MKNNVVIEVIKELQRTNDRLRTERAVMRLTIDRLSTALREQISNEERNL